MPQISCQIQSGGNVIKIQVTKQEGPGNQTWTSFLQKNAMQRGKEKENCILLWKFFGLYSVVHLVFNKMCQAQLKSGRFSRLRLKSELSSLNCSYCHSAPGQIPRFPDYQSQQYQELSNLGERTAHPSAHTLAQHLTTFEKSYEYYNKVCRRNVAWGSPIFMTPMCLCVCCVEIVIFLIYFNL